MKNLNFTLASLFLVIVCLSCQKERVLPDDSLNTEVSATTIRIEDNTLAFESKDDLTALLEKEDEEEVNETLKNLEQEGFSPLRPVFSDIEGPEVDAFLASKASRISQKGKLYSFTGKKDEIEVDDEIIADEKFAKILNVNREIYVGDNYYIYTTNGLYFCKRDKKKVLQKYLKELENSKSFQPNKSKKECAFQKAFRTDSGVLNLKPVQGSVTSVTNDINHYDFTCDSGGDDSDSGGNTGGSSSGGGSTYPLLVPQNFGSCAYTENSLFQQVFGHTIKCNDYHDSTHRIQTKVWNENYLLWATVGASAKYQKKRWVGWSESITSEGVRLGINHAIYTYKSNITPYNANDPKRVIFSYKGVQYDFYGNVVPKYPINPSAWPFPVKETVGAIDIYIFGDDFYFPLSGKQANKTINKLLSQARGAVKGLSNDMSKDKVGVQIVKYLPTSFKVTQVDVLLKHRSQAKKTFDFNFKLKFKSDTKDWFQHVSNQLNAKKYDKIDIDMYGAARRSNSWKGKRIQGKVD